MISVKKSVYQGKIPSPKGAKKISVPRRSSMKTSLTISTYLDDIETRCSSVSSSYTPLSPDSLDSITNTFSTTLDVSAPHCVAQGCSQQCGRGKLVCKEHNNTPQKKTRPVCQEEGCSARALDSVTNKCTRHGGGPRCTVCSKPSIVGGPALCFGCAGLKRCTAFGCKRAQVGESGSCERHRQILIWMSPKSPGYKIISESWNDC